MSQHIDIAHEHERIENAIDGAPKAPTALDSALAQFQASTRAQIVALAEGPITSKSMAQLQRFCASVGAALVTLERPDQLVRDRFRPQYGALTIGNYMASNEDELGAGEALAPAPAIETYGTNASRGLIESAAKIGKDIVNAQAEAQRAARAPSITDMVNALAAAKEAKVSKSVIKVMEQQIADAALAAAPAATALALPPPKPKTRSKR